MLGFYVAMTPMLCRAGARDVGTLRGLPSSRRDALRRSVSRPSLPWLLDIFALAGDFHLVLLSVFAVRHDVLTDSATLFSRYGFVAAFGWIHIFGVAVLFSLRIFQRIRSSSLRQRVRLVGAVHQP
jgi:hypothetical protein